MSILPQGATLLNNIITKEADLKPTKTYKIDFDKGTVVGLCDEVEALKQAIYLILITERFEYLIYSWNYGIETKTIIGKSKEIAESEYKRIIKEALVQDDRIKNVDKFIFEYDSDSVLIKFTVFSIYGDIDLEKEARL